MKFVDLSQDPPQEVTVYTIREVANHMNSGGYASYSLYSMLQNWHDDPEISTPKPAFIVSDTEYWKPEQVAEWNALYATEVENEEQRKVKRLETTMLSKADLVEKIIEIAKAVESLNSRCYTHNRGNSMQDGRKRVLALEGQIGLVTQLLGDDIMPKDKRAELNTLVAQAKKHVQMQ